MLAPSALCHHAQHTTAGLHAGPCRRSCQLLCQTISQPGLYYAACMNHIACALGWTPDTVALPCTCNAVLQVIKPHISGCRQPWGLKPHLLRGLALKHFSALGLSRSLPLHLSSLQTVHHPDLVNGACHAPDQPPPRSILNKNTKLIIQLEICILVYFFSQHSWLVQLLHGPQGSARCSVKHELCPVVLRCL